MVRRGSRRSPVEAFIHKAVVWLIALFVFVAVVSYAFQAAPQLALFLFILLPIIALVSMIWFRRRTRIVAARDAAEQAKQRVESARQIGTLLTGSGPDFELTVADVLRAQGYDLHRVGGSGDRGVDLVGTDVEGRKIIVQCKRYGPDNKVGSPAIQSFVGTVVNQDANQGIFVTTSTYTRGAQDLATSSRVAVTLIDGLQFSRMAAAASARLNQQSAMPPTPAGTDYPA